MIYSSIDVVNIVSSFERLQFDQNHKRLKKSSSVFSCIYSSFVLDTQSNYVFNDLQQQKKSRQMFDVTEFDLKYHNVYGNINELLGND